MQTRCPHCRTVYSVEGRLVEELDARVRCGACMTLFNARDCLLADADVEAAEAQAPDNADLNSGAQHPPPSADESAVMPSAESDDRIAGAQAAPAAGSASNVFEVGDDQAGPADATPPSGFAREGSSDVSDVGDMTAELDWPQLDLPDPEFAGGNYGPPVAKAQVPLPAAAEPDAVEAFKGRAAAGVDEVSSSPRSTRAAAPAAAADEATSGSGDGDPPAAEAGAGPAGSEQRDGSAEQVEPTDDSSTASAAAADSSTPSGTPAEDAVVAEAVVIEEEPAAPAGDAADSMAGEAGSEAQAEPDLHGMLLDRELAAAHNAPSNRGGWLWALGALLLLFAIISQLLFWQRDALAANPSTRGLVATMCGVLGCELEPLRDVERIELLQRSVYSHPNATGALIISVSMVNNAGFAQPYPTLAIRMADVRGRTVAARDFAADDYLKPGEGGESMPVGAPVTITLEVLDPGRDALTFELDFL